MKATNVIGLDSQCLSYLIDAMYEVRAPKDKLASEKIALLRTYLYTPGTLYVTPTVVDECARIRAVERRELHDSFLSVLIGEWQIEDPEQVEERAKQLLLFHSRRRDCRILAEAEHAAFAVLLSYDLSFLNHFRDVASTVALQRPSEYWTQLSIPRGTIPNKVPAPTNLLQEEEWWKWN